MSLTAASSQSNAPAPPISAGQDQFIEYEIRPHRGWVGIDFAELCHYRELLYFLTWRDVKVRYKQTVLGAAWAIIQPLANMLIATAVFGHIADLAKNMPQELQDRHVPYCVFAYAGLLAWMFVSTGVSGGGMSLMNAQNLLTKIYFPRLFVPAAVIGAAMVDTLISFAVFFVIMAFYRVVPPWTIVFVPGLFVLTTLTTLGIAFALAALTITYRDFRFLVPFMVQVWMFISPAMYPLDSPTPWKHWALSLNPMFGIIRAYRSCLLGEHWDFPSLLIAIGETAVVLLFGLYYFKKTERRFADIA